MYKISEDQLHELARLFMSQFLTLEPLSLDEFLSEYAEALTDEQCNLGHTILEMFNN